VSIDLAKVKRFNETLFSDIFKREDINGNLEFENATKSYMIVPLKLL